MNALVTKIDLDFSREKDMNDPDTYQWYEDDFYIYIGKVEKDNIILAKVYYLFNSYTPGLKGTALVVITQEGIGAFDISEARFHLRRLCLRLKDEKFGIVFLEDGVDVNYD